jgi:hypothetical protein
MRTLARHSHIRHSSVEALSRKRQSRGSADAFFDAGCQA